MQLTHLQRDEAWNLFPYCCVGRFTFLDLSVRLAPEYPEVLSRVKAGEKYLDVGCCFGQDIRQLVYDGAPPQNVYGTDLEAGFFRLGHKLFKDRATLSSEFIAADMTSTEEKPLDHLEGTFSFIHASSFFHLFDWATQVQCAINCVRLLKPQSGSIIFGRHSATNEPKEIRHPERGTKLYRHSDVSWKKMWVQEVGPATGTKWRVEAAMIADTPLIQAADFGPAWMRMRYTCTME